LHSFPENQFLWAFSYCCTLFSRKNPKGRFLLVFPSQIVRRLTFRNSGTRLSLRVVPSWHLCTTVDVEDSAIGFRFRGSDLNNNNNNNNAASAFTYSRCLTTSFLTAPLPIAMVYRSKLLFSYINTNMTKGLHRC
jgi:hypothetical protein